MVGRSRASKRGGMRGKQAGKFFCSIWQSAQVSPISPPQSIQQMPHCTTLAGMTLPDRWAQRVG
jgi:hypothetical protein